MCGGGGPSMPEMPKPQPLPEAPPPAPAPPPMVTPEAPTPPPVTVPQGDADAVKVKKRRTKRQELQQKSQGANALRIPLNTGGSTGKASGLNIPK